MTPDPLKQLIGKMRFLSADGTIDRTWVYKDDLTRLLDAVEAQATIISVQEEMFVYRPKPSLEREKELMSKLAEACKVLRLPAKARSGLGEG